MRERAAELHADWLSLVEPEGQFLTVPVLKQVFKDGLDTIPSDIREVVRDKFPRAASPTEQDWDSWLDWLFGVVLRWGPYYKQGEDAAVFAHGIPEHGVILRATAILHKDDERPRVLVLRFPHGTPLTTKLVGERWNTSPLDRLTLLCRSSDVRVGIVTDGERIVLAWVPESGVGGHATWETALFLESKERRLFQSFTTLLHASRFFGVRREQQLEALFAASEKAQHEVTTQLGFQVRQAVELLVSAISWANLERDGKLLAGIAPQTVYEGAVTVMMRLVFLLYSEERDLLPLSEPLYADHYAISTLREQLETDAAMEGDEPLERRGAAWYRLLATFRALYAGLSHDRLRLPPYGGRLFDPDRYPFLEGRGPEESWLEIDGKPLPIDDLTVKAILDAIQTLPIRESGSKERRRLSFRSLDVEQIGHVYEGLLDHGAERIDEVYLGLVGRTGDEAELALAEIEAVAGLGEGRLVSFLVEKTAKSESAVRKLLEQGQALTRGEDAESRRLLLTACERARDLVPALTPYAYLLRKDLHGLPLVFPRGSLVVKQTRARRESGTEYTPRELAEEMVRYALEPLVYSPGPRDGAEPTNWRLKASTELLDLKICDPAAGSGAFLVAAVRYLADRVAEAWISERPDIYAGRNRDELTLEARRAVVDRCIYGVDRDAMAVEMAKLSLWLVTLAKDRPFSFLDHSIRCGDSLLGVTSLDQILSVHIDPSRGRKLHDGLLFHATDIVRPLLDSAARLRRQLEEIPDRDIRDAQEKRRLNDEANHLLDAARVVADGVIATALATIDRSEKKRDGAFQQLSQNVLMVLGPSSTEDARDSAIRLLQSESAQRLNIGRPAAGPVRSCLHWPLVFPEIFTDRLSPGFDVMIGNPPFVGGQKIAGAFGSDYRDFLAIVIADGRKGSADIVTHFFLRAAQLSHSCAFLAVNTIAQGETREVGLDALLSGGWLIFRATKSRPWPGSAGVHVAQVWLRKGAITHPAVLNGEPVPGITSYLAPARRVSGAPYRLSANVGKAFFGSYVLGSGFLMSPDEAADLVARDPRNIDVLFPFINADDLCSRPGAQPSRWVINFFDWPIEKAAAYKDCLEILRLRVQPFRETNKIRDRREKWWQFAGRNPQLYESISGLKRTVVMPIVSKVVAPLFTDTRLVFSHAVAVIARDDDSTMGILTSTVHRAWARSYASTLESRTRYAPTDCFETFPFPDKYTGIAEVAKVLYSKREEYMRGAAISFTAFHNRVHDPSRDDSDLRELRELYQRLDRVVVDAYEWHDIDLGYGFHESDEGRRWTLCEDARVEVLERLLQLNHGRYAVEIANGTALASGRTRNRIEGAANGVKINREAASQAPSLVDMMRNDG
jgi:hypothetical protein